MSNTAVAVLVSGLLSGGSMAGIASFITGRATARKVQAEAKTLDAKLPAEVDSVIVAGAEQAVLTMDKALQAADRRIAALESELAGNRRELDSLRVTLDRCQRDLAACREELEAVARRLAARSAGDGSR